MTISNTRAERRERLAAAGAIELPAEGVERAVFLEGGYTPAISPGVRDAAYIGGLITTGLVAIAVPTVSAIVPDIAGIAAQIGTAVLSGVGLIVSGLGVVYRPGASR